MAPKEKEDKSFLRYFLKKSFHGGVSLVFRKNFALIFTIGLVLQYYISPSSQPKMSFSFWINGALLILGIGLLYLIIKNWYFVYCVIVTLPRDVRGGWRFYNVVKRLWWAQKNQFTVPKLFDYYANRNPDRVCFYFEDETWTFRQVQEMSNQVGNYMAMKGLKKGDTAALFMENRPEFVCIWMGLSKIGACAALINYNLRLQSLVHCIGVVKAKAVIYGHELTEAMQEALDLDARNGLSSIPIYCSGHKGSPILEGVLDFDKEINGASKSPPKPQEEMRTNDNLFYIYTSGTTGLPKAAMIKQHRFMMAANGIHYMNQVKVDDILYDSLPLYHMTGGMVGIGQALLFGTSIVIRKRFSASQFWKDCIKYNVTVAQYLGETCRYLLAQPPSPEEKMHKVRLFSGNGLRQEIWQEVVDRFGIREIGEVYGSTEGNCNVANVDSKVGAVGFVPITLYPIMPMTLVRVDEKTGEPIRDPETGLAIKCKANETGELVGKIVKHHPIRDFQGYTDDASTNKKIIRSVFKEGDSSFRTGDILVMDEFGYFYFRDRTGDTFRWKGENVSTTEVEAVISNNCSYKDAVVYGVKIPNTEGRAGMVAIGDHDGQLDLEYLANALTKSLPPYARPLFLRVADEIDKTGTYKLKKLHLQSEGYDITKIQDKLYFLSQGKFEPIDKTLYNKINSGKIRL